MPAPASRVVFLGLDGGTTAVLRPAFERGWMPHLAAYWRRAASGALRSSVPMVTPVAWTSFSTGCRPEVHGVHEFYRVEPGSRTIHPNGAGDVKVPTLWEHLGRLGREVVSLNLPMSYPPPAGVRGIMVGGSDAPGRDWAFVQCPEFGRLLAERVPGHTHKIVWKGRPRTLDDLRALAARNRESFRALGRAALLADERCDWTALLVHFHDLDSLQHRLWPYLELEDGTAAGEPEWTAEVVSCLRALDAAVGELLELADRRDAAVIALSDHGFGPCRALVDTNGLLRRAGLQRGLAYGTRFAYRFHRLADRLNRWRGRRGAGTGRRHSRSVEGQVGCDWRHTVAYAPYGQLGASVFLHRPNLPGAGAVDRAAGDVIETLLAAHDPETGAPLFADAFRTAERYGLDPVAEGLPDVIAPSADGYQAQAKWSPFDRRLLAPDPALPATHFAEGVLAVAAPGVRPGAHLDADLIDVAPTALAALGLPVPAPMQGRPLREAFGPVLPPPRRRPVGPPAPTAGARLTPDLP
jgi:predicted AlkP superfamily phosphohydrolase/phosphomutase